MWRASRQLCALVSAGTCSAERPAAAPSPALNGLRTGFADTRAALGRRIDEALAQLRRAFPTSFPSLSDFTVTEPADYPDEGASGYGAIQRDYIEPLERAYALSQRIGTAIANEFGAHG